jgi:hypothetical protein
MVAAAASDLQLGSLADSLRDHVHVGKADADEESDDASTKAPTTCSSRTSWKEETVASSRTDELSVAAQLCAVWEADQASRQSAAAAAVRDLPSGTEGDNLGVYVMRAPVLDYDESVHDEAPALDTPGCALIVWDWDDTLCPTTWLCAEGLTLYGVCPSQAQLETLRAVDDQVSTTLEMAKTKGTNVIITNAERGWVQLAAKAWMPKLAAALRGIRIVSARTEYESASCPHPIVWKARAFGEVTKTHFATHGDSVTTLISFGDSAAERQAALQVWPSLVAERGAGASVYMKSIKLPERPTVTTLNSSHTMLVSMLTTLVEHAGHLDLVVAIRDPAPPADAETERCIEV